MLFNILIRTCYRAALFDRCIQSVLSQTYKRIRVIVSYDDPRALTYIPTFVETMKVTPGTQHYYYDQYCNQLKKEVEEGYFMFLDDDDFLKDKNVIGDLIPHLKENSANIVRMDRKGKIYPKVDIIQSGQIGMPCMVLYHSHKSVADIPCTGRGDSVWIIAASKKLPVNFINLTIVKSDRKGSGRRVIL